MRDAELARFKVEMAKLHSELRLLRWMTGANLALTIVILVKVFAQ